MFTLPCVDLLLRLQSHEVKILDLFLSSRLWTCQEKSPAVKQKVPLPQSVSGLSPLCLPLPSPQWLFPSWFRAVCACHGQLTKPDWVEWVPTITQEKGKRKSAARSEGHRRISTPVTWDPYPCCGTRFSEAESLKTCFSLLALRVQSCVYDMSDERQCTLLSIISHLRNRCWRHNKLRIHGSLFFHTCFVLLVDVSAVRGLGKQDVNMDRIHWAGVSLISLLPTPWKTLERRSCLVTMLTGLSVIFQCLLENSQLSMETGTIHMLGFSSGSSQSTYIYTILLRVQEGCLQGVRRLKSVSFLEFCHFTHYLNCSSDFIMQENVDKADLSIIKRGKLCQMSTWINEFSLLTSVSIVR